MERFKKMDSILSVPPARKDKATIKHPAVFPVGLPLEYIKAISHENGIVCEPFCGSGTTIIAAEQCGRVCYGMELDPIYCDVIRKRWAEFVHGEGCDWQTLAPEVAE